MDTQLGQGRLHRSRRDRMLFGVCGGLGEYFALDPVLVRLAFVLITLAGGAGVLAYVILAIVMPDEGTEPLGGREGLQRNLQGLRTDTTHLVSGRRPDAEGPFVGDAPGPEGDRARRRNAEAGALLLVAIGLVLLAGNVGWMHWFRWDLFWPLVLIALGAALLLRGGRARG